MMDNTLSTQGLYRPTLKESCKSYMKPIGAQVVLDPKPETFNPEALNVKPQTHPCPKPKTLLAGGIGRMNFELV